MASTTAIVISRPEHLTAIRKRLADEATVTVCSETDSLHLFDAILERPPDIVLVHSTFAASSRGATLIAGIKAKPNVTGTAIRVFIEDEDKAPLILFQTTLSPHEAMLETSRPLDRAGTRQAARYPMNRRPSVVNGDACQLVDLSVSGAQVQVPMRLRPSQVVRFALPDDAGEVRCQGTVAWSIAVPSGGAIHYRVGLEFVNPDSKRLAAICATHGGAPDPTLSSR